MYSHKNISVADATVNENVLSASLNKYNKEILNNNNIYFTLVARI